MSETYYEFRDRGDPFWSELPEDQQRLWERIGEFVDRKYEAGFMEGIRAQPE